MESWQVVAELIEAIGARWQPVPEPMHDSWVDTSQPNWQIVASQTIHSQPDNTQMTGQKTNEDTDDNWGRRLRQVAAELTARADKLQLSWQSVPEPTHCSWVYRFQLRWKCSALCDADTKQLGWADILHLSQHIAAQPTGLLMRWHIAFGLSWHITTQLTYVSWVNTLQLSLQIAADSNWNFGMELSWHIAAYFTDWADRLQPSWHIMTNSTDCSWADITQLSWWTATKATDHDWADWLQVADRFAGSWHMAMEPALDKWSDRLQLICDVWNGQDPTHVSIFLFLGHLSVIVRSCSHASLTSNGKHLHMFVSWSWSQPSWHQTFTAELTVSSAAAGRTIYRHCWQITP